MCETPKHPTIYMKDNTKNNVHLLITEMQDCIQVIQVSLCSFETFPVSKFDGEVEMLGSKVLGLSVVSHGSVGVTKTPIGTALTQSVHVSKVGVDNM